MEEKNAEVMGQSYWKCSNCGYILQVNAPPEECPSCHKKWSSLM